MFVYINFEYYFHLVLISSKCSKCSCNLQKYKNVFYYIMSQI